MSILASSKAIPETVMIPAGPFLMGTSHQQVVQMSATADWARKWVAKGYFEREQPQHAVSLPDYCIGVYPVTVFQFSHFIAAKGYHQRDFWTDAGWEWLQAESRTQPDYWLDATWTGQPELPVVGVSWYEAWAYCRWLSRKTGRAYRLPTEAEWEKAARGSDGRLYPWGNLLAEDHLNMRHTGLERTVPVDHYQPVGNSPFGCVQMVGNVSEWTLSQFRRYPYEPYDGREDPEGQSERVIRGGSWFSPVFRARTTARGMGDPCFTDNDVGFRCLREP